MGYYWGARWSHSTLILTRSTPVSWTLDQRLRDILVCPRCKGPLDDVERGLLCKQCALVFLVIDDVPMMLESLAKRAELAEMGQGT